MYSFESFFVVYCLSLILFFSMLPKRKNIIESQKKRIISTVLSKIYRKYSKFHFPIMSKFPLLNFAFPDNSVEYYVMSMRKNKTIRKPNLLDFAKIWTAKIDRKTSQLEESAFRKKTLILLGKIKLWGSPKIIKFAARNEEVKLSAQKLQISQFFGGFWLPKST